MTGLETPRMRWVALRFGLTRQMELGEPVSCDVPEMPRAGIVLISGPSGSGKTTLLMRIASRLGTRCVRGDSDSLALVRLERIRLPKRAMVDCFRLPLEQTLGLLSRAGLAEARLWLRPAGALSAGEQFRFRLALWMAQRRRCVLLADEFCNSLDRVAARAIAWQLRRFVAAAGARGERRLAILATAHEDLAEDLMPTVHLRLG